jgi:PA14 domain
LTLPAWRSLAVLSALTLTAQNPPWIQLTAGMVIDRSAIIRPGTYRLPTSTTPVDFRVTLEYRGAETLSPRGVRTPAGTPVVFEYSRFFAPIEWTVRFFEYGDGTDPVKQPDGFRTLLAGTGLKTIATSRLDYLSGRGFEEGVPRDRFALSAEGTTILPAGDYVLQVISDDGVRVWMDGAMVLDDWTPHESHVRRASIRGGRRHFKVEYYEATGFAELRCDIQRK